MNQLIKDNLLEIKSLFEFYNIESAYIFGSDALDKLTVESDIDFFF